MTRAELTNYLEVKSQILISSKHYQEHACYCASYQQSTSE